MSGKDYCSFCGKSAAEVLCLIAGPTVFICDECVGLCNDIVFKHRITEAVQKLLPDQNIEAPPCFRPTEEFIAEVRAKIAASAMSAGTAATPQSGAGLQPASATGKAGDAQ